jgi:hypothetical protein
MCRVPAVRPFLTALEKRRFSPAEVQTIVGKTMGSEEARTIGRLALVFAGELMKSCGINLQ